MTAPKSVEVPVDWLEDIADDFKSVAAVLDPVQYPSTVRWLQTRVEQIKEKIQTAQGVQP